MQLKVLVNLIEDNLVINKVAAIEILDSFIIETLIRFRTNMKKYSNTVNEINLLQIATKLPNLLKMPKIIRPFLKNFVS